jgi:hypothetical protein
MKGRASFKHYAQKDVANARKVEARRITARRDWNVRAIKTMPAGTYEVMIMDGDLPFANAWVPRRMQTVLDADLIPEYPNPAEALAAYEAAGKPSQAYLDTFLHPDIRQMTCLHLMRLAPGVNYGLTTQQQLGESGDGGSIPGVSEHSAGSGGGPAATREPQPGQLVAREADSGSV